MRSGERSPAAVEPQHALSPPDLGAVPDGCRRSLDVGCGEGMLTRDLRRVVPHVTGIDRDAASIDVARRQDAGGAVKYVVGDFMTHPFAPASFDHIASIGVRYRRQLLFRYSLVWSKPA